MNNNKHTAEVCGYVRVTSHAELEKEIGDEICKQLGASDFLVAGDARVSATDDDFVYSFSVLVVMRSASDIMAEMESYKFPTIKDES